MEALQAAEVYAAEVYATKVATLEETVETLRGEVGAGGSDQLTHPAPRDPVWARERAH